MRESPFHSHREVYFYHPHGNGRMRQKDPEQGFIPRGAAAQVTQPHEAGRNGDLLLDNLQDKKPDWLCRRSREEQDTACFRVLETHQRREAKGIPWLPRHGSW